MGADETPEVAVARTVTEETAALIHGDVVGEVDGLVWEDASGFDIVCVTILGHQIAVPVEHGGWREGRAVELDIDMEQVAGAPQLRELQAMGGSTAVDRVGEHFSMNLTGPPPGPDPQPLPPWWPAEDE
jgi:hypothetical protein